MTRFRLALILLVLAGSIAVAVLMSGGSGPDRAACKEAMREQFAHGMTHPDDPPGSRPAQCAGVSDKDLQRFASEIMNDYLTQESP